MIDFVASAALTVGNPDYAQLANQGIEPPSQEQVVKVNGGDYLQSHLEGLRMGSLGGGVEIARGETESEMRVRCMKDALKIRYLNSREYPEFRSFINTILNASRRGTLTEQDLRRLDVVLRNVNFIKYIAGYQESHYNQVWRWVLNGNSFIDYQPTYETCYLTHYSPELNQALFTALQNEIRNNNALRSNLRAAIGFYIATVNRGDRGEAQRHRTDAEDMIRGVVFTLEGVRLNVVNPTHIDYMFALLVQLQTGQRR